MSGIYIIHACQVLQLALCLQEKCMPVSGLDLNPTHDKLDATEIKGPCCQRALLSSG